MGQWLTNLNSKQRRRSRRTSYKFAPASSVTPPLTGEVGSFTGPLLVNGEPVPESK